MTDNEMEVWIVKRYYRQDNKEVILGIFSTQEKAESYLRFLPVDGLPVDGIFSDYLIDYWIVQ